MDDKVLLRFLRHYFHHADFKNATQKEAIIAVLKRNADVFISFPSGYGRTMCYQLPSLIHWNKMSIIIMPRVTRIMSEVNSLRRLKIHSKVISTSTDPSEKTVIYDSLKSTHTALNNFLYVTPDQVSTPDFKSLMSHLIQSKKLSYIVVDETHCESQWIYGQKNHEYHTLGKLRRECKDIPWIVATATAGIDVVDFLKRVLYIKESPTSFLRFSIPCYRQNIYYDVAYDDIIGISVPHLTKYLERYLNGDDVHRTRNSGKPSGLIFCKTRQVTEQLVRDLKQNGFSIAAFHAGLENTERYAIKDSYMKGYYQILAVTSTSGMEINKPNIRLIVHWGLPSSITAYYYETGQAGKDGFPARCRIYLTKQSTVYYNADNESILAAEMDPANTIELVQKTAKSFLVFLHSRYMKDYCEGSKCRHSFFADYFGDEKMECIDKCDICSILSHSVIQKEMQKMGLANYIKNICLKYQEMDKTFLTTKEALSMMKACKELVTVQKMRNLESKLATLNKEQAKVRNSDVEPLPSTSLVENDDKKDKDQLPSSKL
ncbi:ATP-dependent DNA helicase Q5-like [Aphis craccivora]|uniref:ATP-dependent DNA helicase n=1 Tax=Aphis craccivora TaxID=307492 RepID=A0A6G0YRH1_APHCR|nr:ATP-dependent DNA helicase Q5-like [Aphis craccivora]